jgi:predicted O-methyltransferase YrrM
MNIVLTKEIYNNLELLPSNLTGWHGDSKVFHQLIDESLPKRIIEVGTWLGQSLINMGTYCQDKGYDTTLISVDTFLGAGEFLDEYAHTEERQLKQKNGYPQIFYQTISNVVHAGLKERVLFFPNTSLIAATYFNKHNIKSELIYIDGSHDYLSVSLDLKYYYPLLSEKGIMFGDDYYHWLDVKKAVDEFVQNNKLNLEILENNFWVIRKN